MEDSEIQSELRALNIRRGQIKAQLTRFTTFVNNFDNTKTMTELQARLEKIELLWKDFDDIQTQIELIDNSDEQVNHREDFENLFFNKTTRAKTILLDKSANLSSNIENINASMACSSVSSPTVQLPSIQMPKFDGKYEHWMSFKNSFNALINNNKNIHNIQKFIYLQSSLTGDAVDVIADIETDENSYNLAWSLLESRYENKKVMCHTHVKALFELISVGKDCLKDLHKLVTEFNKHIRALKNLGEPTDQWSTLLLYLVFSKLDPITQKEWNRESTVLEKVTIDDLMQFLSNRCLFLETVEPNKKLFSKSFYHKAQDRSYENKTLSHVAQNISCYYCKGTHLIYHCKDFEALPLKSKYEEINKLGLCTNCLRKGHSSITCQSTKCKKCHRRHNTILHNNVNKTNVQGSSNNEVNANVGNVARSTPENSIVVTPLSTQPVEQSVQNSNTTISMHHNTSCHLLKTEPYIMLSTAIVNILDSKGNLFRVRAVLDGGSQSHFMSKELCQKLNLPVKNIDMTVLGVGNTVSNANIKASATVQSKISNYSMKLTFLVVNKVTNPIPAFSFDKNDLEIPEKITLADPDFNVCNKVDLLLGAEIYHDLLCAGKIKLGHNKPTLIKSRLGWILAGPVPINNSNQVSHCHLSTNQAIQDKLETFWRIEELDLQKPKNKQEQECEKIFSETTRINSLGHYVVHLPFVNPTPELGDSRESAINRFLSLEQRLNKNRELKHRYIDFMSEYESLRHMTRIPDEQIFTDREESIYYLPHHGVVRENSLTTKLRVVFNGSFQTSNDISLNDLLLAGPQLQEDLFSIILRFRKHNFVMIADIEKMYRMVEVTETQRDFQRIVWRHDANQPLSHYRLNTLTYGTVPASFLAIRCLHECAYENQAQFPQPSQTILSDFYVDDLITGSDSVENAITLKRDISNILSSRGFHLRKWASNERSILTDDLNSNVFQSYLISDDTSHKTLGLQWHSDADILKFTINVSDNDSTQRITKRVILSTISQIFDPMGLIGPITIKAKIILQRLWQSKLNWDDPVPHALEMEFQNFKISLPILSEITIPRHVILHNSVSVQMHGFSDASQHAYGACLYLFSSDSVGNRSVNLLCAKSRVAPLKVVSLPRLELCGALLLSQLANKAEKSLKITLHDNMFWCDSSIVLNWIKSESTRWQTFVANRVAEIQRLTAIEKWRHISSDDNPADTISRGLDPHNLKNCSLWWKGPPWLLKERCLWPTTNIRINFNETLESKKNAFSLLSTKTDNIEFDIINKYSSLSKLQRVIAYCFRFAYNCSRVQEPLEDTLTIIELDKALIAIIKLVQAQVFGAEIQILKQGKSVFSSSKLSTLNPFIDKNNVVRVGGRISLSKIDYDMKFPIVLPSNHHFTDLVIKHEHQMLLHAGSQTTLTSIRNKFWPLKGKSTVKKVLRKCIICFRARPLNAFQKMGDLPEARITPTRPFLVCGTDFAGPFYIKDGKTRNRKIIKSYLCIFVCFSSKAVHFELVGDLTSDSFLNSFKRFVSRRGLCTDVYSDNGTNYTGANNELREIYAHLSKLSQDPKFIHYIHENHINWHFAPARSPHFGGLYEAAVKSVKYHLKRIVGNSNLTYEELSTVLAQAEAVLNSRPIVPLSDEPNDLLALTPGHFIIGEALTAVPQRNVEDIPPNRLRQYERLQQMVQHFWRRWKQEYLNTLQQRHKWKSRTNEDIQPGMLVLVVDENTPTLKWPLARIQKVFPGHDGLVRVAEVMTRSGVFRRAVQKLCPLPLND